ncbi:MAG: hypothetical protein GY788_01775 [bacterium]|nr:hypothetical protein [bacterium]
MTRSIASPRWLLSPDQQRQRSCPLGPLLREHLGLELGRSVGRGFLGSAPASNKSTPLVVCCTRAVLLSAQPRRSEPGETSVPRSLDWYAGEMQAESPEERLRIELQRLQESAQVRDPTVRPRIRIVESAGNGGGGGGGR